MIRRSPRPGAGRILAALVVLGIAIAVPLRLRAAKGRVAVLVNKSNVVSGLSSAELRRILLGEETRWDGKEKITILLLPTGSDERKILLKILLKMSDDDFTRHWISRVFQGQSTAAPKKAASAASMLKLVAGLPTALGIVDLDDVPPGDTGLKVLSVDGKAPNEDGYSLTR